MQSANTDQALQAPQFARNIDELDRRLAGRLVVIESPYSAFAPDGSTDYKQMKAHIRFAQVAMSYVLSRGGIPIAPHLLWTQHPDAPDTFVPDALCEPGEIYDIGCGRDDALRRIEAIRELPGALMLFCTHIKMSGGMQAGLDHCRPQNNPSGAWLEHDFLTLSEEQMRARIKAKVCERAQ